MKVIMQMPEALLYNVCNPWYNGHNNITAWLHTVILCIELNP